MKTRPICDCGNIAIINNTCGSCFKLKQGRSVEYQRGELVLQWQIRAAMIAFTSIMMGDNPFDPAELGEA